MIQVIQYLNCVSRLLLFWYHFTHFGSGVSATCFTVVVGGLISAQTLDPAFAHRPGGFDLLDSGWFDHTCSGHAESSGSGSHCVLYQSAR